MMIINSDQQVLSTVNAVLPSLLNDPEKFGIENIGGEIYPAYKHEDIVNKAFEIADKVQEKLNNRGNQDKPSPFANHHKWPGTDKVREEVDNHTIE